MNCIRNIMIILLLAAMPFAALGGDFGMVTSTELKAIIDRNESGMVIIDSRSRSQYDETHIKGAISIPLSEMENDPLLPKAPKDARLIFYCSGNT